MQSIEYHTSVYSRHCLCGVIGNDEDNNVLTTLSCTECADAVGCQNVREAQLFENVQPV